MRGRLRGNGRLKVGRPAAFGADRGWPGCLPEPPRTSSGSLYAFAVAPGGRPQVFCYEASEEGMAGLANLIRGEHVIKIVRGETVAFSQSSVVELALADGRHEHRLPLNGD